MSLIIQKLTAILTLISISSPALAFSNYHSIYYVPWILVIFSLMSLIPILLTVLYLKKKNKLIDNKGIEKWRSLLIFPTFIGSLGVSLTFFPLLFSLIYYTDEQVLPILLPLSIFCILFILFTKKGYALLKES